MKPLLKLTSLLIVFGLSLTAHAEGKIAVLNVQQAVVNTEVAQERLKDLQKEPSFAQNRKELEDLNKAYQDTVDQLQKDAAVMSAEQKMEARKKLQEKVSDMEHVKRKLQATEQEFMQSLMQELGPKLKQAVDDLIKEEGIGLIVNQQATMYADTSYNITAKVTDKLNKLK